MKILSSFVFALLPAVAALSQTHWKHVKLLSEAPPPVEIGVGAYVNASGVAAFASGGTVYKGSTQYGAAADGWVGGLNDAGQMAWRSNGHVYVEHTDVSAGIVKDGDNHGVSVYGLSSSGVPFWTVEWTPPVQTNFEMYLGTTSLDVAGLLGANRSYFLNADRKVLNRAGIPTWTGSGDAVGHLPRVYRGTDDISSSVLGPKGKGISVAINDLGQVTWAGNKNSISSSVWHAYVDGRDISAPVIAESGGGFPRYINNRGQVLWEGTTTAFENHAFLDSVDYTARVFGSDPTATAYTRMISDSGHILWHGWSNSSSVAAYVDDRDVTSAVLGANSYVWAEQIDEAGHLAWDGHGDLMPYNNAFVDQFDLTLDATGTIAHKCNVVAMGPNGHVLWIACDEATGLYDFWLSTPVPEPSVLLLALPALAVVCRSRRR